MTLKYNLNKYKIEIQKSQSNEANAVEANIHDEHITFENKIKIADKFLYEELTNIKRKFEQDYETTVSEFKLHRKKVRIKVSDQSNAFIKM